MAHVIALSASTNATKCSSQVWRTALKKALDANKSVPNAKYFQVATTQANTSTNDQDDERSTFEIRTTLSLRNGHDSFSGGCLIPERPRHFNCFDKCRVAGGICNYSFLFFSMFICGVHGLKYLQHS